MLLQGMALHCLSAGLQQQVTAAGLREMSLVLRHLAANAGALPLEMQEATAASLAAAKQAVSMGVSDGFSWCKLLLLVQLVLRGGFWRDQVVHLVIRTHLRLPHGNLIVPCLSPSIW